MKKIYLVIATLALAVGFASCSDDDDATPPMPKTDGQGTFVDSRDGFTYHWVRYDSLDWMVENGHYFINNDAYCMVFSTTAGSGSTDYNDKTNLQRFGCLYNIEGAKLACPAGWRIPTDEEWQSLERHFGMSAGLANSKGWRGNIAQNLLAKTADASSIQLQLGGVYYKKWVTTSSRMREWSVMGYYWTSTEDSAKGINNYYYRKLMWNKNEVYRESTNMEEQMFSVRYVRDAQQ